MSITGNINVSSSLTQTAPTTVPGAGTLSTSQSAKFTVASGTALDQADLHYVHTISLVASTPQVLDLTSLTDAFGASFSFARVKSILIVNQSTTSGETLVVGYGTITSNAFTSFLSNPGTLTLHPSTSTNQGTLLVLAPSTTAFLVNSTNKLIQLDSGSHTFNVLVEIVGCSV